VGGPYEDEEAAIKAAKEGNGWLEGTKQVAVKKKTRD